MKRLLAFSATCLLVTTGVTAQTYTFQAIEGNNANTAAGEAQLRMTVSPVGGTQVNFRFFWEGATPMSITQISFDDFGAGPGVLASIDSLAGFGGPNFAVSAQNFPEGNNIDFTTSLQASSVAPPPHNGINRANPLEYLDIVINLFGSSTFADVITALNQGYVDGNNHGLRVGMHVQSIGDNEGSESFVNNIVPLPPAAWAGVFTLGAAAGLRTMRRRQLDN